MGLVVRDIETRSVVDLGDTGHHIYAAHPSTEVLCYGYCIDNGPTRIWHPGREPIPKALTKANGALWVAHNAAFEMAIERNILVPRFGFPEIPIERQICTMAMVHAAALQGALDKVAKALSLENQKDAVGARLMMKLSKPRKPRKGEDPDGLYWPDDPEEYVKLDNYCMTDVATTREVYETVPDLPDFEQIIWMLDQRINDYGFYLDRKLALAARKIAAEGNPRINDELDKITNGVITSFTQVPRITKWVSEQIGKTSLGKAIIEDLFKRDLPPHVRRVLELRLLGAQAAVAKVDALLQRRCPDGRVRGSFVYHAAGPGRWSSRGAQVHNLKRIPDDLSKEEGKKLAHAIKIIGTGDFDRAREEFDNPLSVIGDCIRGMIIAAPGHTLIGGDFSGIEARVTAWIADEKPKLQVFRDYDAGTGPDPYIVAASIIFGIPPEQVTKAQRQVGKGAELAFGFQGGLNAYRRFVPAGGKPATAAEAQWREAHRSGRGAGEVLAEFKGSAETSFTDEQIEEIKNKWREAHPRIKSFWYAAKKAIETAVQHKNEVRGIRQGCPIEIWCDNGPVLQIKLPSGRCLTYPHARYTYTKYDRFGAVDQGEDGDPEGVVFMDNSAGAWRLTRMYGGLATENIVQGIARDLLAEAMLRIDAAGYRIVTHVHDECVIEVPIKDAKRAEKHFTELMMQSPDWAGDLPIRVNSWCGPRYTK
jgi:DNA polymerase